MNFVDVAYLHDLVVLQDYYIKEINCCCPEIMWRYRDMLDIINKEIAHVETNIKDKENEIYD